MKFNSIKNSTLFLLGFLLLLSTNLQASGFGDIKLEGDLFSYNGSSADKIKIWQGPTQLFDLKSSNVKTILYKDGVLYLSMKDGNIYEINSSAIKFVKFETSNKNILIFL